jgi:hypothetical protein
MLGWPNAMWWVPSVPAKAAGPVRKNRACG